MSKLKCPRCGSLKIEYEDCLDSDNCDDTIVRKYCGYCMECDTNLLWEEHYRLTDICNVVEND